MGIVFGLLTAVFYASASIFAKVGQRNTDDDGVYTTVVTNVVALCVVALFVPRPEWDTYAIVAMCAGGIVGTFFGRSLMLRGVRLVGPSRAGAFTTGTPVAAAIAGWIVLGEAITMSEALGGLITVVGLLWLVRSRQAPSAGMEAPPLTGYLIAAAAPMFFGVAFVIRKLGLERFDSPLLGSAIGAVAAFATLSIYAAVRGELGEKIGRVRNLNRYFVLAGLGTSLALVSQFNAFRTLEAWVVGVFASTQGIWTLLMSWVFLREEEHIDRNVVGAILVVALGVTVISLQT